MCVNLWCHNLALSKLEVALKEEEGKDEGG